MCRKRPGPRCSHSGRIRLDRSENHLAKTQAKYDSEKAAGKVSARTQKQLDNGRRRHDAALRVYEATPKGHESIQSTIDQLSHKVTVLPEGEKGSAERRLFNKTKRDLAASQRRLEEGIGSRKNQYLDYHMVGEERKLTRRYVQAQGGGVNKRAQPSAQSDMDEVLAKERGTALNIQQWPDEVYEARANTWVEKGTKTGWEANPNIRPPKGGEGERVAVPTSKAVRLNTPDGQIVEARHDVHVNKNTKGEYVVSERLTVASSWEDASPIDVTTQEVGHIIASKRGFNRKAQDDVQTFKTEKEATAYAAKVRNSVNQTLVKDSAKLGREAFIGRAHKPHVKLMNRGFVIYPRYKG